MWVCTRHTRMRWFKSPWTPPRLLSATLNLFKRANWSKDSFSHSEERRASICLSLSPFLSHTHRRDLIRSFSYIQTFTNTIYKLILLHFVVVVFLLVLPASCSGIKGLWKLVLAEVQVESRDKKCHQRWRKSTGREKWRINRNDLKGNEESVCLSRHVETTKS